MNTDTERMAVILSYTDLEGKLWLLHEKDKAPTTFPNYPGPSSEKEGISLAKSHVGDEGGLLTNRKTEIDNASSAYKVIELEGVTYYNVHLGVKSSKRGNSQKSDIDTLKGNIKEAEKYDFIAAEACSDHAAVNALTKFASHHKPNLIINTRGNGNCPFNATFLNWLVLYKTGGEAVKAHLKSDVFKPFITAFGKQLEDGEKPTTWDEIVALPIKVSEAAGGKALRALLAEMLEEDGYNQRYREMLEADKDNAYETLLKEENLPSQDRFHGTFVEEKAKSESRKTDPEASDKSTNKQAFDRWWKDFGFNQYVNLISDGEKKAYVSTAEAGLVNERFHFNTRVSSPKFRGSICTQERLNWPTAWIRHSGDIHYEAYMSSDMVEAFNKDRSKEDRLLAKKDKPKSKDIVLYDFASAEHFDKMQAVYREKSWVVEHSDVKTKKDHEKISKLRTVDESRKYLGEVELTITRIPTSELDTKEGAPPRGQLRIMPRYIPKAGEAPLSETDKNAFELQQAARVAITNFKVLAEKNGKNVDDLAVHIKDLDKWDEQAVLDAFKAADADGTKFQRIYINGKLKSGTPLERKGITVSAGEEPEQEPTIPQSVTNAVLAPWKSQYGAIALALATVGGGLASTYFFDSPQIPGMDPLTPETLLRLGGGLLAPGMALVAAGGLLMGGKKLVASTVRTLTEASPMIMALAKTPSASLVAKGLATMAAWRFGLINDLMGAVHVFSSAPKAGGHLYRITSNYHKDTGSQRLRRVAAFSSCVIVLLASRYAEDSYMGSSWAGSVLLFALAGIDEILPRFLTAEKTGIEWLVEKTPLQNAGWGDAAKNTLEIARTLLLAGAFLPMTWAKAGMGLLTLSYGARSAEALAEEGTKRFVGAAAVKVAEKGAEQFATVAALTGGKVAEKVVRTSAGKVADKFIQASSEVAEKLMKTGVEEGTKQAAANMTTALLEPNNTHLLFSQISQISQNKTIVEHSANFSEAPLFFTKPFFELTSVSAGVEAVKNLPGTSGWGAAAGFAVLGTSLLAYAAPTVLTFAGIM